jgi:predicted RNA-binding Zn-ribbon protein involved in translation (DUF1610 family)
MSRAYKASNGHIIERGSGGRFRRSTLADVGLKVTVCPKCGRINFWHRPIDDKSEGYRSPGGFSDPADFVHQNPMVCTNCGADISEVAANG